MHPTQAAILQQRAEQMAQHYYDQLPPGLTIEDAMLMDQGGQRNLVLRKALGMPFPGRRGEIVMINQADIVQVVTRNLTPARDAEAQLRKALPGWHVEVTKRMGEGWLVTGCPPGAIDQLGEAAAMLGEMLGG